MLLYPYDYDPYIVSHQELSYHICVTVFAYVWYPESSHPRAPPYHKLILSGLAEPQHHARGKQKFYIKLSHPPPEPIPTALSPSNKKNGIHRPVNSLAAFYAIQIVESPVGARPEGSNLGGLRSYSPLRSRSCVLDATLLCHACTREFLLKAQTQAHADACFPI